MSNLDSTTEDELDPDVPAPCKELFDEATDDGPEDGSTNRGEYNERDSVLLVIGFLIFVRRVFEE